MERFRHPSLAARVRPANPHPIRETGDYVLYWMQLYRRLRWNHALDYAIESAANLGKPLVIYEGLKRSYPWANARLSQFMLEGMRDTARDAAQLGVTIWQFVEGSPDHENNRPAWFHPDGRGLVRHLAAKACLVVTDDYPMYIVPEQSLALAQKTDTAVHLVDGNSIIPLANLGDPVGAAAHMRPRIHRQFAEHWPHGPIAEPVLPAVVRQAVPAPFPTWTPPEDLPRLVQSIGVDPTVPAVANIPGGREAGLAHLREFVRKRLTRYAEERSIPDSLQRTAASGLSPYLRHGHVSIHEIVSAVLNHRGNWSVDQINFKNRNKREGFYCDDADVNSFLDEAITWRDLGYHWHRHRRTDIRSLQTALPDWAYATLHRHSTDRRAHVYTREQWEHADTHDHIWNAAQRELVATGRIHNYLRMLWGKKVLEWSASPEEAYQTLEYLNNKYALDGRDPNSYSGILWTFGLFDRPWPPERQVFGNIRYMSSENTAKKFKLGPYLDWVRSLPTIGQVHRGVTSLTPATLF
ncbi:cryptochrome/DNA photolyase family protein [Tuwongella immobilis]|uniref:Deoxyribodipyrimidine photo-lyase n=1 Tax=Tuwongella immobilis TaxID=692036 RepID=A0A6C2YWZ4_9BACT|nr:deoxyribodipyrimidine photolyase [Tuwongella immobilis]VIP05362.1 deoxyribodipyrimidine photo-lyase : Putative deoxyribodipyrimidine photo-lyase OS=Leptospira licerasiae str. MMD4847 GN=LEP1GSC178_0401 PE=4 SV=1: FAD_binding_7 [Tuwongella immobilis]VTS08080.1 deoxyribodipyrimidine photo-lyase : Putative deoxyribodipyrimidine photo-lyase OS=Leptospira licerasiae str. MMD4847 GN=LEP1GSC178_0401 PE=4 SV=1: FAD_binding_7 [Tuwongella immobilis]